MANMKRTTAKDWNLHNLPAICSDLTFDRSFGTADRKKLVFGHLPEVMEDKWFIYYDQGVLNFHRSWTGFCVYRALCDDDGSSLLFKRVLINRDPTQYTETDDTYDLRVLNFLVDAVLLERPVAFPYKSEGEDGALQAWSLVGKAMFSAPPRSTELVRIVPLARYLGTPTSRHRPYAFYADLNSLRGKSVAEAYATVRGLKWPELTPLRKWHTPFRNLGPAWNDPDDAPLTPPAVLGSSDEPAALSVEYREAMEYVVLRVEEVDALTSFDAFPATWTALSYLLSDKERMSVGGLNSLAFHLHEQFARLHQTSGLGLLAERETKSSLGLDGLQSTRTQGEELDAYHYLSVDSLSTNDFVDLFGLSCRCWYGCGVLGELEDPICRFYLLRNEISGRIRSEVLAGSDFLT